MLWHSSYSDFEMKANNDDFNFSFTVCYKTFWLNPSVRRSMVELSFRNGRHPFFGIALIIDMSKLELRSNLIKILLSHDFSLGAGWNAFSKSLQLLQKSLV